MFYRDFNHRMGLNKQQDAVHELPVVSDTEPSESHDTEPPDSDAPCQCESCRAVRTYKYETVSLLRKDYQLRHQCNITTILCDLYSQGHDYQDGADNLGEYYHHLFN